MDSGTPFIGVDYWLSLSNIAIINKKDIGEINNINQLDIIVPILLVRTDLLDYCIQNILNISKRFILITVSNTDECVPLFDELLQKKELVIWFSKNISFSHHKLKPIPIGPKWQWNNTRFFGEDKSTHINIFKKTLLQPLTRFCTKLSKPNLLYFNFTTCTTGNPYFIPHKNIRCIIKNELLKNFKWVQNEPFAKYIETIATYKFAIAPPGKGIDTHRCWEALMAGTIPIISSTYLDPLFENLPVIIIYDNEWSKITPEFLECSYKSFQQNWYKYNFQILYTDYWRHTINLYKI
jgi:hypothetical protein